MRQRMGSMIMVVAAVASRRGRNLVLVKFSRLRIFSVINIITDEANLIVKGNRSFAHA